LLLLLRAPTPPPFGEREVPKKAKKEGKPLFVEGKYKTERKKARSAPGFIRWA
jgi:hypothetical protein